MQILPTACENSRHLYYIILILLIIVVQHLILNYRVLSLNNVLVNLEINIVHVTIFIVNCCV